MKDASVEGDPPSGDELKKPDDPVPPGDASAEAEKTKVPLANLAADETFLVAKTGEETWSRVSKDKAIMGGVTLVNPPGKFIPSSWSMMPTEPLNQL